MADDGKEAVGVLGGIGVLLMSVLRFCSHTAPEARVFEQAAVTAAKEIGASKVIATEVLPDAYTASRFVDDGANDAIKGTKFGRSYEDASSTASDLSTAKRVEDAGEGAHDADNMSAAAGRRKAVRTRLEMELSLQTLQPEVYKKQTYEWLVAEDRVFARNKTALKAILNEANTTTEIDELVAQLEAYRNERNTLNAAFGDGNRFATIYDAEIFGHTQRSLTYSRSIAKMKLIPDDAMRVANTFKENDILALVIGQKLNEEQAIALTELTGRQLRATTSHYDDCVFIQRKDQSSPFVVTTTTTLETLSSLRESKVMAKHARNTRFVTNHKLDLNSIEFLRKKSVTQVANFDLFASQSYRETSSIKVLYIASTKEDELANLIGITSTQATEFAPIFKQASLNANTEIVSTRLDLLEQLALAKSKNQRTVVVFHNTESLFGMPISSYDGIENIVTCNSYSLAGKQFPHESTDYLAIKSTIEAINNIPLESSSLETFYTAFSTNYNNIAVRNKQGNILVIVAAGALTAGGVTGIVYYNKK